METVIFRISNVDANPFWNRNGTRIQIAFHCQSPSILILEHRATHERGLFEQFKKQNPGLYYSRTDLRFRYNIPITTSAHTVYVMRYLHMYSDSVEILLMYRQCEFNVTQYDNMIAICSMFKLNIVSPHSHPIIEFQYIFHSQAIHFALCFRKKYIRKLYQSIGAKKLIPIPGPGRKEHVLTPILPSIVPMVHAE